MNKSEFYLELQKKGLSKEKMPFSKFIKKYGKRLNCSKVTCSFSNWVYEWSIPKTKTPYVELRNKGQGLVSIPTY